MALIVEDGTGLSTAESYISVANADAYFTDRGNTVWTALTTQAKEQALRAATDYMASVYTGRWAGRRTTTTQALDWPRSFVVNKDAPGYYGTSPSYYPFNAVPTAVARACAELAVRASAGSLLADQGAQVTSETVGPISVTYADGARQSIAYKAVDGMLTPYLKGGGAGQIPVSRA